MILFVVGCTNSRYNESGSTTPFPAASLTSLPHTTVTSSASEKSTATPIVAGQKVSPTPDTCGVNNDIQSISVKRIDNRSYEEVVIDIFGQWLSRFMDCPLSSIYKIDDYKIFPAFVSIDNDARIFVALQYSIKPHQFHQNAFNSGNGTFNEETGWIEYKFICFELFANETEYKVGKGGTIC